jgi:hypothetical protein
MLNENLFTIDKFEQVAGQEYVKNFNSLQQKLTFVMRAPDITRTTSMNFRFKNLPLDVNSGLAVDVDVDSGTVSIPIRVRRKEITVVLLDSLINNTTFTRGTGMNLLMAFRVFNTDYQDSLILNGLQLNFKAPTDTTSLSSQALINMLDSVQVVNYEYYRTVLGKNPADQEPADHLLAPDGYEDVLVLFRFKPTAIIRSFRTLLSNVFTYDFGSNTPSTIVNADGSDHPIFESEIFSLTANDPKEAFCNYPNPFGQPPFETTKIVFLLTTPGNANVNIRIFTLMGELVKSKWNKNLDNLPRGLYDGYLEWDGRNDRGDRVLNGVYLCIIEIKANGFNEKFMTKIAYIK